MQLVACLRVSFLYIEAKCRPDQEKRQKCTADLRTGSGTEGPGKSQSGESGAFTRSHTNGDLPGVNERVLLPGAPATDRLFGTGR